MPSINKQAFFKEIGYQPHSRGQWSFHNSEARFKVPVCGRRYGKSTMAAREVEPKLFQPKQRIWIVGPTYDLGEKEFRVMWNDIIVNMKLGLDKRVKRGYNKKSGDMYIEFPWQTRVEVRSADHPEGLVGESLDHVIMSEAAKHKKETWERFIRPALADRRGGADFPTTPEGYNWLHELWQLGNHPDFPEYESWQFPSWENPTVYPGGRTDSEIKLIERSTTPEFFMQEIGADFASFVGKIYPLWDEKKHVRRHTFNPMWPNYITFDWGFTNPLAAIEFQVDPWDNVYVWREHYKAYLTLPAHINQMKNREQPAGYHLDLAFGDAADPEAAQTVGELLVPCIADPLAKSNWRQGVELVSKYLREYETGRELDEFGTPEMAPKLFVDHDCVNTIREFNNYKSKESPKGLNVPEMGQRQDDHAMDALRYGLMHLFELGARHHLDEVMDGGGGSEGTFADAGFVTTGVEF